MRIIIPMILMALLKTMNLQAQFRNGGSNIIVQNGATLTIDADFINDDGSDFVNNSTVVLKKNVLNDQILLDPTAGTWQFSGVNTQTVNGTRPLKLFNFIVDNPNGMVLNNSIRLYNVATFSEGLITCNNLIPFIFDIAATTSTAKDDSHIIGPVVKRGLTPFTYPVGDNFKYQPIQAEFTENSLGLSVNYKIINAGPGIFSIGGTEPVALNDYNSMEYWDIQPVTNGNAKAKIKLMWDGYKDTYSYDVSHRRVAHKVGNEWFNEGQAATATGSIAAGSVTSNLISTWSPIALGLIGSPLPLTLVDFHGANIHDVNRLNWVTSSEVNVSHFEIERSSNSQIFEKIGEIKAVGNSAKDNAYEFNDTRPDMNGYYRLKSVDYDGTFSYSNIIYITHTADGQELNLYPNPVSAHLNVNHSKDSSIIEILSVNGYVMKIDVTSVSDDASKIDVSNFPAGIYILKAGDHYKRFSKL